MREKASFPTSTVLCSNDRIAFGVTGALWQAGLKIGRLKDCDIRVAGHDNNPLSEYTYPPLTTVAQDYNEIGRLAIELLFRTLGEDSEDRLELPESNRILLNAEIKLRMSA
jgi:DNA-binding LacI/PurR family transcriptional regulator